MRKALRSLAIVSAFGLASVVNPGYFSGCASDTGPSFGEAEMLDLLDEANATAPFEIAKPGDDYRLELSLEQLQGDDQDTTMSALFASPAYACGQRTFRQSASACVTGSSVELRARYSLFRVAESGEETELVHDRELIGSLEVYGDHLTNGQIALSDANDGTNTTLELRSKDGQRVEFVKLVTEVAGQYLVL